MLYPDSRHVLSTLDTHADSYININAGFHMRQPFTCTPTGYKTPSPTVARPGAGGHVDHVESGTPPRSPKDPVVVFDYLDVRAYLAEVYRTRKARGRGWSYRSFSRRVGVASPNHLKRVIDGERILTAEMALRYAAALGLDGPSGAYFCDLAAFGRANTSAEKNAAYERLTRSRGYRRAQKLELAHANYHAHWWLPAIRELCLRPDFRNDSDWIAAQMWPPIRRQDAAEAIETLVALGMIAINADGSVHSGASVVTTGAETRGLHIGNYHRAMMERAAAAIDLVPRESRDISSLTFCVSPGRLDEIKQRVQQFRKEIIGLAADETAGDQVIQLNIQLFPLTKPSGSGRTPESR